MKLLFILVLLFFSYSSQALVFAQEQYDQATWHSVNGDTIEGLVLGHIISGQYIKVKLSADSKSIKKSASQIAKIYQNGVLTVSSFSLFHGGEKNDIFLQLISNGANIGLYSGKDQKLGKLYAVYKNGQFTILMEKEIASNYRFLYGDCAGFNFKNHYAYTEQSVKHEFEAYLKCTGQSMDEQVLLRSKPKSEIWIGPKVGYTIGKLGLSNNNFFANGTYRPMLSPKIGVAGKYAFSKRFSFQTEFSYLKKKASSDSVNTPPTYDPSVYSTFVEFDLDFIDWQLLVNYTLLYKKISISLLEQVLILAS
ncbi:MAG: hypothetical protein HC819_17795 [Cyclobacteriaceae bacterium]|nr:hypothetical protein [Cyclobacteriaceae bacterium]